MEENSKHRLNIYVTGKLLLGQCLNAISVAEEIGVKN